MQYSVIVGAGRAATSAAELTNKAVNQINNSFPARAAATIMAISKPPNSANTAKGPRISPARVNAFSIRVRLRSNPASSAPAPPPIHSANGTPVGQCVISDADAHSAKTDHVATFFRQIANNLCTTMHRRFALIPRHRWFFDIAMYSWTDLDVNQPRTHTEIVQK